MGGKAMEARKRSLSKVVDPVWIILFRMLKKATTPKIVRPEDAPPESEPGGNATEQHSSSGSRVRSGSTPPMLLFNALRCGGSIKTESLRYDHLIQQYLVEPQLDLPPIDLPHSNSSSSSTCTCTSTSTSTSISSSSTSTSTSISSSSTSTSTSRSSSSSSFPHHSKPSFLHLPSVSRGAHCFSRPRTDSFRVLHLVDQDALDTSNLNRSSNGRTIEQIEESLYSANSQGDEEEEEEEEGLHSNSGASILLTCASSSCCGGSGSSSRRCTLMASSPYSSCDEHYGTPASSFHNNAHRCSCLFSISGRISDWDAIEEEEATVVVRTDLSDNAWWSGKCESVGPAPWDNVKEKMSDERTNVREKPERSSSVSSDRASLASCRADWVAMESDNPLADFSTSIAEMVVCGKMRKEEELEALFEELVLLNEPELRPTIALAFVDAMAYLSRLSSTLSFPSPFV